MGAAFWAPPKRPTHRGFPKWHPRSPYLGTKLTHCFSPSGRTGSPPWPCPLWVIPMSVPSRQAFFRIWLESTSPSTAPTWGVLGKVEKHSGNWGCKMKYWLLCVTPASFPPQDPIRTTLHLRYKTFYSPMVAELLDTMDSFLWEPLTPMVSKTWDTGHAGWVGSLLSALRWVTSLTPQDNPIRWAHLITPTLQGEDTLIGLVMCLGLHG